MHTRRDRSRPRAKARTGFRGFTDNEPDFAGAIDVVRSCLLRDDSLRPAMDSEQKILDLMLGFVDLAASLATNAVGPDIQDIDRLLLALRDSDETADLIPPGGA